MNLIADLHTHTLVSNHAYNTMTEMARQAASMGLFAMAVTDHGPQMPDAPHPWYFYNAIHLPSRMEGIWVLRGAEADVADVSGTLDFTSAELETFHFDWLIVSAHSDVLGPALNFNDATQMYLNLAENPYIDMIGHSETPRYAYDYDAVTKVFTAKNKVVEINANSPIVRPGCEANMRQLALACKKNGTKIAVNSDAHSIYALAQFDTVTPLLREIDFPPELIVNASKGNLIGELKLHGKAIAEKMEEV